MTSDLFFRFEEFRSKKVPTDVSGEMGRGRPHNWRKGRPIKKNSPIRKIRVLAWRHAASTPSSTSAVIMRIVLRRMEWHVYSISTQGSRAPCISIAEEVNSDCATRTNNTTRTGHAHVFSIESNDGLHFTLSCSDRRDLGGATSATKQKQRDKPD